MKEALIKGHIEAVVNLVADDGTPFCHILLDDNRGLATIDNLKAAGIIFIQGGNVAWKDVPAKFKNKKGKPKHTFSGSTVIKDQPDVGTGD